MKAMLRFHRGVGPDGRALNVVVSLHAGAVPPPGGAALARLMRMTGTTLALALAARVLTGLPWCQRERPV